MSKREAWDERYAASELVWGSEPNRFVAEALGSSEPAGRALDLACGEGRNAIWLAQRGWRTTGVDFSEVAIERARSLAAERGVEAEFICADVTEWIPEEGSYELVLVLYLQVPARDRRRAWANAARALAPGGELLLIGHALENLAAGAGGPRDPAVLWEPDQIAAELRAAGLEVLGTEHRLRPVEGSERDAIDARIRARRPD